LENIKNYLKEKTYFPRRFLREAHINFFVPIAVILTIIPLIVRLVSVKVDTSTADIYGKAIQTDLFSQKKASYLLFFSILLIIISLLFFKRIFQKKDKVINLILIGTVIFWALTLCSTIFSTHKNYAIGGAFDRAEGFITISCYIILFIYSIYAFKTTKNYKYIIVPILILVVILSFLGIFQYTGHDLINSKLGLFLVLGSAKGKLSLAYETGKLYGTLYHYNYVGSFVAIILPILCSLTIFEKKLIHKIILGSGSLLSVWLLLGSTSRAGIIGIVVSLILAAIIFGRSISKKWKTVLIVLVSIIILTSALNFATKGIIFERIPALITDSLSIFKDTSDFDYTKHTPVKDIKHIDGHADVILQNETIKISYENDRYIFRNSKDEIINYAENNRILTTDDPTFKNISFNYTKVKSDTKIGYINLNIDNKLMFVFRLGKDYTIHLVNPNSKDDIDIEYPETIKLFNGKEKLGSSRAYIWSRAIPLLKNNLILGSGPDTFIYQFPQNDLIGKYYAYDTPNMIVDKPHNLYLQISLNEGLIALLAFLSIMVIYIIDSMKLYALKGEYNYSQVLGAANCLGIVGYLFAGIFNDSVISVAPIFWIVLGAGVAINFINRNNINENHDKL
jgi:hypothetical protein